MSAILVGRKLLKNFPHGGTFIRQLSRSVHNGFCTEDNNIIEPDVNTPFTFNTTLSQSQLSNVDYEKSVGNFVVDGIGNTLLDLFQQNGVLPLGYNHPNLVNAVQSMEMTTALVNLGSHLYPPDKYFELLDTTLLAVAPKDLSCVHTVSSMSNPITYAVNVAAARYQSLCSANWDSSYKGFSEDENLRSKYFSVLAFEGSTFNGGASPFNISYLRFPQIRYPYEEHIVYNRKEENTCLEQCFETVKECANSQKHAVAFVVDPLIVGEGSTSPEFYDYLRAICTEFNVAFIVNEVETGMGVTGKFWAYEHWNLTQKPDIVVFGKKMMTSGFYFDPEFQVFEPSQSIFGMADEPSNLLLLDAVIKTICKDDLFQRSHNASLVINTHIKSLEDSYPNVLESIHCHGTLCGIHFIDANICDEAEVMLLNAGLHFGRGNERTLIMRPSLIFNEKHAEFVHSLLESTIRKLSIQLGRKNRTV